jgi:DNA-binding transcriptional ArsR family regulator
MTLKENATTIKKAALVLRAINHDLRRRIFEYLQENPGTCVTKLYKDFELEQSVASQHLAILRTAGFVIAEREHRHVLYSANEERLNQVAELSEQLNAEVTV